MLMFVTFEGIEGCGKSTQVRLLSEWLSNQNIQHVLTREPGGTAIGKEIRKILLSEKTVALAPLAEALLYLADRLQHVSEIIRPNLEAGKLILCDRFHDSTVAYQGYARKLPLYLLDRVWRDSGMAVIPDVTFLFDVAPEIGIRRSLQKLKQQGLDESRFEKETLQFHAQVRAGFLELARLDSLRIIVIDGTKSSEEIHQEVLKNLQPKLFPEK